MDVRKYSVGNYGGVPSMGTLQQYMPDVVRQMGIQSLQAIPGLQSGGTTSSSYYMPAAQYTPSTQTQDNELINNLVNSRLSIGTPQSNPFAQGNPYWDTGSYVAESPSIMPEPPQVDWGDYGKPVSTDWTYFDQPSPTQTVRKSILSNWNPETGFGYSSDPGKNTGLLNLVDFKGGL